MSTGDGRTLVMQSWPARSNAAHNPYQALMSSALESQGWTVLEFRPVRSVTCAADVWVWHWPEGQFTHSGRLSAVARLGALLLLLLVARVRRIPVVWTAHNLGNHTGRNLRAQAVFHTVFHRSIAGVQFLSESSRREALRVFPRLARVPYTVVAHGHYRDALTTTERAPARQALGLEADAVTVAFVGKIQPYKGLPALVEAFSASRAPRSRLLIAGAVGDRSEPQLHEAARTDPRIILRLGHLADTDLSRVLGAADVVALPYLRVMNSGSALLALSMNRPVLVPAGGVFTELRAAVGEQWVRTYSPPLAGPELCAATEWARQPREAVAGLSAFDWAFLGAQLSQWLAREVLRDAPRA